MPEASVISSIFINTRDFLVEEIQGAETRLIVRGCAEDLQSWMNETGIRLPDVPNTIAQSNIGRTLWLGPDEWLVEQHGGVSPIVDRRHDSVCIIDVSDYHDRFRFRGNRTRERISRVCPLDMRPSKFGTTNCVQTVFGEVNVILSCFGNSNEIDLYVARSLSSYVKSLVNRISLD